MTAHSLRPIVFRAGALALLGLCATAEAQAWTSGSGPRGGSYVATPRGAVAFLRTAKQVLAAPDRMLWMNAPGRFSDVRERPVPIAIGMSRLPEIAPEAMFVPLALDYPFWTERKAEMLAAFGPPIPAAELLALDREARIGALSAALGATMDRLTEDAIARDPARFNALIRGREGMGGIYDGWRRLRAALRGKTFDARHDPQHESPQQAGRERN